MKINYSLIILSVLMFSISCSKNEEQALLTETKLTYELLLDSQMRWKTLDILTDSISIDLLSNTLIINIADINISKLEDLEYLKEQTEPDQPQMIRQINVETKYDNEFFMDSKNVFTISGGYGMSKINGIEHYSTSCRMLIPIKIDKQVKIGNDTLELVSSEIDFIRTNYKSLINGLETTSELYLK